MENEFFVGEVVELLTTAIFNFAQGQFEGHGVDATLGRVIIENVKARQADLAFNAVINSKLPTPKKPEPKEAKTGTVEDLQKDLENFYKVKKEEGE